MAEEVNEYENIDLLNEDGVEDAEEIKEKVRRSGVIYMSSIPLGMTVNALRKLLKDYGVNRIYLVPMKEKQVDDFGKRVQGYKEGWAEFTEKLYAKFAEYRLNGKPIGGKRSCAYKDDLWTIKYLHKFKWHHLMDKFNFNKTLREKRLKTEIAQTRRENNFIIKNYERSKMLNKKTKRAEIEEKAKDNKDIAITKEANDQKEEIKRRFKQKQPIIKNKKRD